MQKRLSIFIIIMICMLLTSCTQWMAAESDSARQSELNTAIPPDFKGETVTEPDAETVSEVTAKTDMLDFLIGYYGRSTDLSDDRNIFIDFFIYKEEDHYYGYMNLTRYEHMEGQEHREAFACRLLMELSEEQEFIQAVCVEDFSESDYKDNFGAYQEGDLLFTLKMEEEELHVSWEKFLISGLEDINFFPMEECLSVELISPRDTEIFLRARGVEDKLFFRYVEEESGLGDYLKVYYDEEKETGAGVYCIQHSDGSQYCSGFDIAGCRHEKWEEYRFDVIHDGRDLLEEYEFEKEYNEDGQIKKMETKGVIEGWAGSPYEDTIVRIEYYYREDGALERKECYYNDRVFGTTEHYQIYYYDEQERLECVYSYITHGALWAYYIYEGAGLEPEYGLRLDFHGAGACTDFFVKYDGE